jgi:hypothetical protein
MDKCELDECWFALRREMRKGGGLNAFRFLHREHILLKRYLDEVGGTAYMVFWDSARNKVENERRTARFQGDR